MASLGTCPTPLFTYGNHRCIRRVLAAPDQLNIGENRFLCTAQKTLDSPSNLRKIELVALHNTPSA